jgi:uroporphyrinogen-III synthase
VRLLVTRPEPDGARTAAALHARGHEALQAPLLRTEPTAFTLPDESWAAVILTSANAARAVAAHGQRARIVARLAFAVGQRTAAAARDAGFVSVHSADGNQGDLLALIRSRLGDAQAPLLYLVGEDRAGDLVGDLAAAGLNVVTVVAYRAIKAKQFSPEVAAALAQGALDGVLHFSRRSAEAYLECAAGAGLGSAGLAPLQLCLSQQVAAPLVAAGAARIRVAARPDEAALLALAQEPPMPPPVSPVR